MAQLVPYDAKHSFCYIKFAKGQRTQPKRQFVDQFGSFQSLTSRYGGAKLLKSDLENVKEHLYVPMANLVVAPLAFTLRSPMTPETFTRIQIEKYRHMSGEQRLLIGLKLHELSCEIARDGIRGRYPDADQVFVEEQLHQRLRMAYASQLGVEVIDNAYLDHWAKRIGVDDLLKHIREGNVPPKST